MKIGIDVSPLWSGHKFRGVGFYTKRLVEALKKFDKENEYIFTNHQSPITNHPDIIHYPYFDLFFLTLPIKKPAPTVVTIHDVIPLIFPEKYPKGIRGWLKLQIQKFSLRGVSMVITDSKNSKNDINKYLGFPKEKIFVVPLAPGEEFKKLKSPLSGISAKYENWKLKIKQEYRLPDTFALYVGDINWNKNIPGLIKAFKAIEQLNNRTIELILVGKAFEDNKLPETRAIVRLIEELGLNNRTRILGFVPTKDLVGIYNLASVYCQPSFYEGFCLPVLEAMACGTPVACSRTSSLTEVVGDAAVFVEPDSPDDIARGIKRIIEDRKFAWKLQKMGLRQAKKFSWEKTVKKTIGVYEKVSI